MQTNNKHIKKNQKKKKNSKWGKNFEEILWYANSFEE